MRLQAFGKSLVEFVNRTDPEKSLLLLKPTLRIPHTGGERIRKATPEEKVLRSWIAQLAAMPPAEVASALEYRKREAAGHGEVPTVVLRRLTHAQYDNTVRDLLKDTTGSGKPVPAGGLRQRLQEPIRRAFGFAVADAGLRPRGGAAGGARVSTWRFARLNSLQARHRRRTPGCRSEFVSDVRPKGIPAAARARRTASLRTHLSIAKDISRRRASGDRGDAAIAELHFLGGADSRIRNGSPTRPQRDWRTSSGIRLRTTRCSTSAAKGELKTAAGRGEDGSPDAREPEGAGRRRRIRRAMAAVRQGSAPRRVSGGFTRCSARNLRER